MALERRLPDMKATQMETHWWGDTAVDPDGSDKTRWTKTGDPSALKMRAGRSASIIRYRGLTVREVGQLPPLGEAGTGFIARCYEAARYGLISIEGQRIIKRRNINGLMWIDDDDLDGLTLVAEPISMTSLMAGVYEPTGAQIKDDPDDECQIDLALWIGGMILRATFRAKRDGE